MGLLFLFDIAHASIERSPDAALPRVTLTIDVLLADALPLTTCASITRTIQQRTNNVAGKHLPHDRREIGHGAQFSSF